MNSFEGKIVSDPMVCSGKPCVKLFFNSCEGVAGLKPVWLLHRSLKFSKW